MSNEIPKWWCEVLLPNVAAREKFSIVDGPFGSHLKLSDYVREGTVPVLTTKNLTETFDPLSVRFISLEKFEQLKRSKVVPGDILIAKIGSIGKCSIYPENAPMAIIPANLCKITVAHDVVTNRFLLWQIRSKEFQEKLKNITSATAQPAFSIQRLKFLSIKVAPFEEQLRIVAKLEKLLSKVETCQKRLSKIPVILKRFRHSVLAAACSGRLTSDWRDVNPNPTNHVEEELPPDWRTVSVGEVINNLKYGTSQKCSYERHGVPVIRIPNIEQDGISHSDLKYAELPKREFQQLKLKPGDVLLIRSNGSVSLVGKSALVRETERDFAYAGYLIRLRPNVEKVLPKFLNLVLGSHEVRIQLEVPARSTSGVNNINSEEVRALRFFLPTLPEQQEIVRRVDGLFALVDQIETRFVKAKTRVDQITQCILGKAFRGELVRQDPNDEPASVLLERIRTERTKGETEGRGGGRKPLKVNRKGKGR